MRNAPSALAGRVDRAPNRGILGIAKRCWPLRRSLRSRLWPVPVGRWEFPATTPYHTHQVIELPEIQMHVTHVVLHEMRCPQCGHLLKAELPAEYRYGYGPRLTALIGELSGSQRDSRTAVQEFCWSVLGFPISRGAIQRMVDRVSEAITPYYEAIAEKARSSQVNYIDETAWYQHGVLAWLWVMVNATVAFFTGAGKPQSGGF